MESGTTARERGASTFTEAWAAPLDRIARRRKPLDTPVERHRPRDVASPFERIRESQKFGAIGVDSGGQLHEHLPLGAGLLDAGPRDLWREVDPPLGSRLGSAARLLVARRRGQQNDNVFGLDEHMVCEHDVLVHTQGNSLERLPTVRGIGKRTQIVTTDRPQRVNLPAVRRVDRLNGGQPAPVGHVEAPQLGHLRGALCGDGSTTRERPRHRSDLRAALHPAVASDRHEPTLLSPEEAASQGEVDDGLYVVDSKAVLGNAHAPDEHRAPRLGHGLGEVGHAFSCHTAEALELRPRLPRHLALELRESLGVSVDEFAVDSVRVDEVLEHPVEKRDVATLVHLHEVVGQLGAEERAVENRRNPIPLHRRLTVRVHDQDIHGDPAQGSIYVYGVKDDVVHIIDVTQVGEDGHFERIPILQQYSKILLAGVISSNARTVSFTPLLDFSHDGELVGPRRLKVLRKDQIPEGFDTSLFTQYLQNELPADGDGMGVTHAFQFSIEDGVVTDVSGQYLRPFMPEIRDQFKLFIPEISFKGFPLAELAEREHVVTTLAGNLRKFVPNLEVVVGQIGRNGAVRLNPEGVYEIDPGYFLVSLERQPWQRPDGASIIPIETAIANEYQGELRGAFGSIFMTKRLSVELLDKILAKAAARCVGLTGTTPVVVPPHLTILTHGRFYHERPDEVGEAEVMAFKLANAYPARPGNDRRRPVEVLGETLPSASQSVETLWG